MPPHLAAAQQAVAAGGHAQVMSAKPVRLGAVGRVRHTGLLNGAIPGSSAAAAAVSFYNGNAGAPQLLLAQEPWSRLVLNGCCVAGLVHSGLQIPSLSSPAEWGWRLGWLVFQSAYLLPVVTCAGLC